MNTLIIALALVACASAQVYKVVPQAATIGRYYHDDTGAYHSNEGKYNNDNSGAYIPDGSGAYVHDDAGYKHDDAGYRHQEDKYRHQNEKFGNGAGIVAYRQPAQIHQVGQAAHYAVPVGLKQGNAAGLYDNRNYAIIRKSEEVAPDGYHYLYETENKILAEEQGKLERQGSQDEAINAAGFYEYTGPDAVVYRVDYTANEDGFVPTAAHIPTPPPIPALILKSLEYQRAAGKL
ncbi:unnamed protein product [Brassicogethes aeneus]|uniref:Uncharacterized protein n=1 Tax=Brassicogethes aeneus TaxID=1431903 RepID=A0A9P0B9J1_BRAAE|nr:unnamed protein product [Brassicogethes aeneus]